MYIREGVVTTENEDQKEEISKLLLFESSSEKPGALTNLPAYVQRMKPTQRKIYYLCAPRLVGYFELILIVLLSSSVSFRLVLLANI